MKPLIHLTLGIILGIYLTLLVWNLHFKDTYRHKVIANYQCWHNHTFNEPCDTPESECTYKYKNGKVVHK